MRDFARILMLLAVAACTSGCGGGGDDAAAAAASPGADPVPVAAAAVCELDASAWDESVWL